MLAIDASRTRRTLTQAPSRAWSSRKEVCSLRRSRGEGVRSGSWGIWRELRRQVVPLFHVLCMFTGRRLRIEDKGAGRMGVCMRARGGGGGGRRGEHADDGVSPEA